MNKISMALIALTTVITMRATAQSRTFPVLEGYTDVNTAAMGGTLLGYTQQMHIYTNPAAMSFGNKRLSVDASTMLQAKTDNGQLRQYNIAAAYQLKNRSALLVGARYLGGLDVPSVYAAGEPTSIKPYDIALDFGYSFMVTPQIAVYATTTYVESHAATSASALAFSVGTAYQNVFNLTSATTTTLTIGARLLDFGKPVKFNHTGIPQSLPTSVVAGGDWQVNLTPQHTLTYAASCRYFTPKQCTETVVSTGLDYTYNKMLSARIGYLYGDKVAHAITFGVGAQMARVNINAAYHHAFALYGIDAFMVGIGYAL